LRVWNIEGSVFVFGFFRSWNFGISALGIYLQKLGHKGIGLLESLFRG